MRIDKLPHVMLVYDIPNDRARTKIADTCLDYGLDRIQYSAFYGRLSKSHQEDLMIKIQKVLGKASGNIQLIPVADREWQKRQVIDQGDTDG